MNELVYKVDEMELMAEGLMKELDQLKQPTFEAKRAARHVITTLRELWTEVDELEEEGEEEPPDNWLSPEEEIIGAMKAEDDYFNK